MPNRNNERADRRRANGGLWAPWTCSYQYTDREGVARIGKGRTFIIDGRDVDLFPVGVLVRILGRERKALYSWEKNFGFPHALYRVRDDKACNRWYSRNQIVAIQTIYELMGKLRGKHRKRLHEFITAVRQVFYTVDVPTKERVNNGVSDML